MAAAEQRKQYHISKSFKGVNTQANRTAIDADEFAWLENVQPIGYGNIKTVPGPTTVQVSSADLAWSGTVDALFSANIGNFEYIVAFFTNGGAEAYNATSGTKVTIANSGKFSAAGMRIAQWKNERILIVDPVKGLFNWDGTNVVLYLNGVEVDSTTSAGVGNAGATGFSIGAGDFEEGGTFTPDTTKTFDGFMDEVLVYSDDKDASTVLALYESPCDYSQLNLVARYALEDDYTDAVGTYDLTASGSPTFNTEVPFTDCAASGGTTITATTTPTDSSGDNLYHGFVLFFIAMLFPIWFFRRQK